LAAKINEGAAILCATMLLGMGTAPTTVHAASFTCSEAQRHSFAVASSMTPAYPGRTIDFTINGSEIIADGVFFHTSYDVTYLSDQAAELSFRAHASDADREDIFLFTEQTLYHTAIVKYGREPSIQMNILTCQPKVG
jgi:hypothetical protein